MSLVGKFLRSLIQYVMQISTVDNDKLYFHSLLNFQIYAVFLFIQFSLLVLLRFAKITSLFKVLSAGLFFKHQLQMRKVQQLENRLHSSSTSYFGPCCTLGSVNICFCASWQYNVLAQFNRLESIEKGKRLVMAFTFYCLNNFSIVIQCRLCSDRLY